MLSRKRILHSNSEFSGGRESHGIPLTSFLSKKSSGVLALAADIELSATPPIAGHRYAIDFSLLNAAFRRRRRTGSIPAGESTD